MKTIYDMTIIGAGPAGSFCAHKLASQGFRVLLLEGNQEVKRKICGEYLSPSGVDLLIAEGLKDKIVNKFLPIEGMQIVPSNLNIISTLFPDKNGKHIGIALNRKSFDEMLIDLTKESGGKVIMGAKVQKLVEESYGWNIETQSGDTFRSRIIIGADGRSSTVAKLMGLKSKVDTSRVAIHCHIKNKNKNRRLGEMHLFSDGSYIGIDPTGDYELNISLVCDSKKLKDRKDLNSFLNSYITSSSELANHIGEIPSDVKVNAITPITNKMSRCTGKKFALIGDAAGFLDPLTGEGMFNGLWMAKSLANEFIKPGGISLFHYQTAIDKYEVSKRCFLKQKYILNKVFQFIIKKPILTQIIARYLKKKQERANIFVGIIGNIYRPLEGLLKLLKA